MDCHTLKGVCESFPLGSVRFIGNDALGSRKGTEPNISGSGWSTGLVNKKGFVISLPATVKDLTGCARDEEKVEELLGSPVEMSTASKEACKGLKQAIKYLYQL